MTTVPQMKWVRGLKNSFPGADYVAGHADWHPHPSRGFSSIVTPLVGQDEFGEMMQASYDS